MTSGKRSNIPYWTTELIIGINNMNFLSDFRNLIASSWC